MQKLQDVRKKYQHKQYIPYSHEELDKFGLELQEIRNMAKQAQVNIVYLFPIKLKLGTHCEYIFQFSGEVLKRNRDIDGEWETTIYCNAQTK